MSFLNVRMNTLALVCSNELENERISKMNTLVDVCSNLSDDLENMNTLSLICMNELKNFNYCRLCKCTKTPMWREGPTGQRTLCNGCGIRYKRTIKKL